MKQNKRKIAITGGIGSGKSTVAKIISDLGYPVFSCDETYAELLKDKNFLKILSERFGDILNDEGELDRNKLSQIVFSDTKKLKELNDLTHPKIFDEMFNKSKDLQSLVFYEVPLLFEEGNEKLFDDVIVVLRDLNKRVVDIKKRDNLSEDKILCRIKSQYNYEKADFAKYYVTHNNGDFNDLARSVVYILDKLNNN
jgi:dephospho-CoA kinase